MTKAEEAVAENFSNENLNEIMEQLAAAEEE